ncbi:hypothetical protein [Terrabacter sp. 2YAF2]|uniref:hypothetical protein n=1 Tax=Terrabacter sp. 2YAF2 TaxID=3233026 RepID=UPI003F9EB619
MRATKASLAVLGLSAVLAGGVISGAGAANAAPSCEGGYPPAQCKAAISDNTVRPGQPVSFQADGFRGGESVSGDVHSVVVHVGTYAANSKGVVTGTFTVPSGLSNGSHTFTLTGLGSGVIKSARFSVTGAPAGGGNGNGNGAGAGTTTGTGTGSSTTGNGGGLAMTGTNVAGVVGGGAALVLAGGALMVATRRRKHVNAAA